MAARDAARRRGPARQRPEPAGNGPANGPAAALRRPVTAAGPPARLPAARRGAGPRPGGVCVCVGGGPGFSPFSPRFSSKWREGGYGGFGGFCGAGGAALPLGAGKEAAGTGPPGPGGAALRLEFAQGLCASSFASGCLNQRCSNASSLQLYMCLCTGSFPQDIPPG